MGTNSNSIDSEVSRYKKSHVLITGVVFETCKLKTPMEIEEKEKKIQFATPLLFFVQTEFRKKIITWDILLLILHEYRTLPLFLNITANQLRKHPK